MGQKLATPQNVETYFDYWFMPDQKTQELILSYCNAEQKQLPITDHLLTEQAEKHTYSGTLDIYLKKFQNKK